MNINIGPEWRWMENKPENEWYCDQCGNVFKYPDSGSVLAGFGMCNECKDKDDDILDMDKEWDHYSGLPNPKAYDREEE